MPKKNKVSSKQGSNKKKNKSGEQKNSEGRLQLLQERFDGLTLTLAEKKQLRKKRVADNEWLQGEIARVSGESAEYSAALEARAHRHQNMVVSVSDQNAETMKEI